MGGEPMGTGGIYTYDIEVIGFELDILGKKLNFRISVGKGQAKLADIVPLARTLCTKITDVMLQSIRSDGGHIPCRKGCPACCSYLVPLSVAEALRLKEEISAVPAYRRESIWKTCLLASRQIFSQRPPKPFMCQTTETSPVSLFDLNLVSNWYKSLKLACPFLCNRLCTIYEQRPLACREHFVKDSAKACGDQQGIADVIEMPVLLPNALGQLASEFEGTTVEAVILPLALAWCGENPERAERTWSYTMMVKRFVEIVQAMACKNSTTLVV